MTCPRCQGDIKDHEMHICRDCGWMPEAGQKNVDNGIQRKSLLAFIAFTLITTLTFLHTSTWDQHSGSVLIPKVAQVLGIANQSQLMDIADMCGDRMLVDCQEQALEAALKKAPNNLELLGKVATMKTLLKKDAEAKVLFARYFELGGKDTRAGYKYAGLLTEAGEYEMAEKYYVTILKAKPDVLQVSVNQAYVEMLVKSGNLKKALKHIDKLRKNGAPEYFLSKDYAQIEKRI